MTAATANLDWSGIETISEISENYSEELRFERMVRNQVFFGKS